MESFNQITGRLDQDHSKQLARVASIAGRLLTKKTGENQGSTAVGGIDISIGADGSTGLARMRGKGDEASGFAVEIIPSEDGLDMTARGQHVGQSARESMNGDVSNDDILRGARSMVGQAFRSRHQS